MHIRKKRLLFLPAVLLLFVLLQSCRSGRDEVKQKYDIAAFYWPDYHDDPRLEFIFSDRKGEWQTIYNARPKDSGERQPRVPLWGYEDESDPEAMDKKIQAAITHGVNIFIFDWYWYDNKPLLESCLDSGFLKANHGRMKFYIMWANHDATSYWDPANPDKNQVYWKGTVDRPIFDTVADRIIHQYFIQPSYYKINGKPVFSIYELSNFIQGLGGPENAKHALDYFRKKTVDAGFPGLYLQAILWSAIPAQLPGIPVNSQDQVMKYFGFDAFTNYTWAHLQNPEGDYEKWADSSVAMWKHYSDSFSIPYNPNVSVGWDANPRFPYKTGYITNSTPGKFKKYLIRAKQYVDNHPKQPQLITINAWNEWSEGSYLEPDTLYKMGYLDAVKEVFNQDKRK
jgi:hypothetical protein